MAVMLVMVMAMVSALTAVVGLVTEALAKDFKAAEATVTEAKVEEAMAAA